MSDKWTSGPWRITVEDYPTIKGNITISSTVTHDCIATLPVPWVNKAANARLIAQAPAMAALLRELIYSANGHELPIPLALKLQEAKQLLKDLEGS